MLIFWHARLVILSTPKTGTTALAEALAARAQLSVVRPPELKHTPAYRYQRFVRPWLVQSAGGEAFETVALIREPLAWLSSWYRFRARAELAGSERSTLGMSFAEFVEAYLQTPRPPYAEVGGQAKFLSGASPGTLGVDRLFRYENMPAFLNYLEKRLGAPIKLPQANASPAQTAALPPDLVERLRAHLALDYALWQQAE